MTEERTRGDDYAQRRRRRQTERRQSRRDFLSYIWGFGLSLVLTLVAFALVHWHAAPRSATLIAIGVLAVMQMIVHFHFFLHIGFWQKREDLQLILFSALVLFIMIAGTVWIMTSLAARTSMPFHL